MLVQVVDGPLDGGDGSVGGVEIAGLVFFVPEVIVGAVIGEDERLEVAGGTKSFLRVPVVVGFVMESGEASGVQHESEGRRHKQNCIRSGGPAGG